MIALAIWMIGFLAVSEFSRFTDWKFKGKEEKTPDSVCAFFWIGVGVFLFIALMK